MSDKEEKIFEKPVKPKRKLTEKQLAALAAGREKARKKNTPGRQNMPAWTRMGARPPTSSTAVVHRSRAMYVRRRRSRVFFLIKKKYVRMYRGFCFSFSF